jgi:putative transcription antitermination factor YqgF
MDKRDGILALDFGTRRVGIAISHGFVAEALESFSYLDKEEEFAEYLKKLIQEQKVTDIAVGLPLDEGKETEQSRWTRKQIEKLADKLDVRFHLVDESYSSLEAESGLGKNEDLDSESARIILEQYLQEDEATN